MSEHSDRTFSSDFKRFFLRGLVILLPSVLTLWLIVMAYQFIEKNIAEPINRGVRLAMVNAAPYFTPLQNTFDPTREQIQIRFQDLRAAGRRVPGEDAIRAELQAGIEDPSSELVEARRQELARLGQPVLDHDTIRERLRQGVSQPRDILVDARRDELFRTELPVPGEETIRAELRQESIRDWWVQRPYMNLIGLVLAVVGVYSAGRLLGGYFGRKIYERIEAVIVSIPIFKQVYPSVKQVVDFLFSDEQPMKFNRVVVAEYPRKGIWSVGFLTGPTLRSIAEQSGDAVTIFIPSSPTPFTGYTITVPRSEVIEVPLTVDEAIRFAVSGGVLIPDHQQIKPGMTIKGKRLSATEGERIPLTVATGEEAILDSETSKGRTPPQRILEAGPNTSEAGTSADRPESQRDREPPDRSESPGPDASSSPKL